MDSLSALNAFVRAAEFRSFTSAGRELRLSSSAVGKTISRLEERHGVRLFHRSTRSITLTQEGHLFLDSCRRIFSEIASVEQEFAETRSAPKGKLRVSMPMLGGMAASALSEFASGFPEIELDVDFSEQPNAIIDSGYDAVVRAGEIDDSRLMSRRIGSYCLILVCSPTYLARRGTLSRLEDLRIHACVHLKDAASGKIQRWPFVEAEMSAVDLPIAIVANTTEAVIAFAEAGIGIACVPDFSIQRQLTDGALCQVLDGCLGYQGNLRVIWPSSRYIPPKLRAFIDFLVDHGLRLTKARHFPGGGPERSNSASRL